MQDPSAGTVPPAPGWWLAADGNWYPPQARPGGPPPGPGENPPVPWHGPPPGQSSSGRTVAIVLGIVGAAVLGIAVVSILAITFLGSSASSKFSSVGEAVDPDGSNSGAADGYCDGSYSDPDC